MPSPVAAELLYPFTVWLLSPIIASAAMSLSSVSIVATPSDIDLSYLVAGADSVKAYRRSAWEQRRKTEREKHRLVGRH